MILLQRKNVRAKKCGIKHFFAHYYIYGGFAWKLRIKREHGLSDIHC